MQIMFVMKKKNVVGADDNDSTKAVHDVDIAGDIDGAQVCSAHH